MITRLTTVSELKQIFVETLLNNTSKVNKISDGSVLSGVAFGVAKVAQKAIKDIALVESHLLPDSAYGIQLDDIATSRGISTRFGASDSSTFVRVVGTPGTTYTLGTHTFTSRSGIIFDIEETTVIGTNGYAYIKVRSQTQGEASNVDALNIDKVSPIPSGHDYVVNEYAAFGGRDVEQDDVFRERIKEGINLAATDTLSRINQVMMKINSNVLRTIYQGINADGQIQLAIVTQNGIDLNTNELGDITDKLQSFLALSDLKAYGTTTSQVVLQNISYQSIDITFRVEIQAGYDVDSIRKNIQIQFSKYIDYRFWTPDMNVEWDVLLSIVRNTVGVKSVPDTKFIPNKDVVVDKTKLPRIRSFMMLDLAGNIISNVTGTLNPIYYPNNPDSAYQQTILATI